MVPFVFDWILVNGKEKEFNTYRDGMLKDHSNYKKMILNSKSVPFSAEKKNLVKVNLGIKASAFGKRKSFFVYSLTEFNPDSDYKPIVFLWNPNASYIHKMTLPGSKMEVDFYILGHNGKKELNLSNFINLRFNLMKKPKD